MEKIVCKECGTIFEYEKLSSCKAQLKRHIREVHHMSILDYVVKFEYGGKRPLCPCGCGHELNLAQNGDRWKFTKYYADTCYGNLVRACNEEVLKQYKETHKRNFNPLDYYETHYNRDTYEKAYNQFKTKEVSLAEISKAYNIDKRTLKKVWLGMQITTPQELSELLHYTQYILSAKNNNATVYENEGDILGWMYQMIKHFPGKYTIHSLISEYNVKHTEKPCKHYDETILKSLYRVYGEEIDIYLAVGYHSSEEYKFYQILSFYLKDYVCKLGKRFILDSGYVYYDFLIGSRLLIEYDSDGKFHNNDETLKHDKDKEKFALENGYKFLRLNKNDIENIETISLIKNILDESNRNNNDKKMS